MLFAGQHFSEEIIERIRVRMQDDHSVTRTGLSREVCTWLDWRSTNGRLKEMSCRVALLALERRGVINLPLARPGSFVRPVEGNAVAEWSWPVVEMTLSALGRVWLMPVDGAQPALSRQWQAMLQTHHPLGAGPLCGAQLRYLVMSQAGVLGGLSFSAPAWRLAARDT